MGGLKQVTTIFTSSIYSFLNFVGYYAIVLFLVSSGAKDSTQQITIPIRFGLILILISLLLFHLSKIHVGKWVKYFFLFVLLYLLRLLLDDYNNESYYLSISEVFLYFFSFCVLPFVFISLLEIKRTFIDGLFYGILLGGFAFGIVAYQNYFQFIGQISRLTNGATSEDVISPITLSYSATLTIGVILVNGLHNKRALLLKLLHFLIIGLCFIPFFLGASRGSFFALISPFIFYITTVKSKKTIFRFLIGLTLFIGLIFAINDYVESDLMDRLFNTFSDSGTSGNSRNKGNERLDIWSDSINQFMNNPFFGDKLRVDNWINYPHNIFIESLQTTGVFGFIVLIILNIQAWKSVWFIFANHKKYYWVCVLFIQAFSMNMFSGAIYNASWYWSSMAIVLSLGWSLKNNKLENV